MAIPPTQLSDTSVALIFSSYFLPPVGYRYATPCLATGVPVSTTELAVLLQSLALMSLADRGCVVIEPFEEKRLLRMVRGLRVRHVGGGWAPGLEGAVLQVLQQRAGVAEVGQILRRLIPRGQYPHTEACTPTTREVVQAGYAVSVEQQRSFGERLAGKPSRVLQPIPLLYGQLDPRAQQLAHSWHSTLPHSVALREQVREGIGARLQQQSNTWQSSID
jgi:hypothetical protein